MLRRWLFFLFLLFTFNTSYTQPVILLTTQESLKIKDTVLQNKEKPKVRNKFYKSPGKAMLLSALLPGAGQFYTENYAKGAIITVVWGTLGCWTIRQHLRAQDALAVNDTNRYIEYRDRRNNFLWWTAAVWVFSIADAYVSSHMYKFKEQETLSQIVEKISWNLELAPALTIGLKFQKNI